jgi:chemotaxis methyl-accepting protein methylase/PAS domain-containing protein
VPADSGLAFVIVQHLNPQHSSALPELLQKRTAMQVVEAADNMPVQANHVYVIPPNRDLSVHDGKLCLVAPVESHGLRLPIDFFLRSLAQDRKDRAIGIVLSGMGSDGVFGLRAIKDQAGLTLAQEPTSARAASMPRSAIEAGVVDIVATTEALPEQIMQYLRHRSVEQAARPARMQDSFTYLGEIVELLRKRSGNDFSLYKTNTLHRRIDRRMAVHRMLSVDDYLAYLGSNPEELDLLFKELLIGVTSFFRDPEVWDYLRNDALPQLLTQYPAGKKLRAWVAACSTGEEAYTLAMVFHEVLEQQTPNGRFSLQIYATDLDGDAIDQARKAEYPDNIVADVSPQRLARFFEPIEGGGYRIRKDIREMVVFASQNVVSDPPFTRLDILSCRNLLIYLDARLQKTLLPLFHYALNPDGILVLGVAETVGNNAALFESLDNQAHMFRRRNEPRSVMGLSFPGQSVPAEAAGSDLPNNVIMDNLAQLTDQLIQQNYAPAAVLVNAEGDILYISGRTGKYLEPAAGKTNMNLYAMAREGLRQALVGVIFRALKDPQLPILLPAVKIDNNGEALIIDLTIQAIEKPDLLRGRVLVVFRETASVGERFNPHDSTVPEAQDILMQELQQTREALQTTHEEMQTRVEELKSSNEELQSTNEELTTSKEELQSLNEELQTLNGELQSKVDELTWARNDMNNLLNSTEIATVFLDSEMQLRRFTTHATRLFKLIPGDVGRPLSDVVTDLDYPQLIDDAQGVQRTLVFQEKTATTHNGRWYRVRIMPYRTQENRIDGVVMTFIDITEIKQLEAALRRAGSLGHDKDA